MTTIVLRNIVKTYANNNVVNDISFTIKKGEILTLLGPSGCGKTTTLRMIAGFIKPNSGSILFGEKDVTNIAPQNRNTAMVFQSYALWPHLSVEKNIEFGLNVRKISKEEKEKRIENVLKRVKLLEYKNRMPSQLSGGQQQRIAVARALVINPDVLLLDEPLSNLDAKLRVETRQEIRKLVKSLNLTTIFVTHDQSEALSISDRIAVLENGNLRQIGTPEEIWLNPKSAFVGSFIGEANSVEFVVSKIEKEFVLLKLLNDTNNVSELKSTYFFGINNLGEKIKTVIRPDLIMIHKEKPSIENIVWASVLVVMFFGNYTFVQAELINKTIINIHAPSNTHLQKDQEIHLEIKPNDLKAFGPSNY